MDSAESLPKDIGMGIQSSQVYVLGDVIIVFISGPHIT